LVNLLENLYIGHILIAIKVGFCPVFQRYQLRISAKKPNIMSFPQFFQDIGVWTVP
jgi:hypothetical protein